MRKLKHICRIDHRSIYFDIETRKYFISINVYPHSAKRFRTLVDVQKYIYRYIN